MGAFEIILLICGIVFLILSFLVGNEKPSHKYSNVSFSDAQLDKKLSEAKKELWDSIEEVAQDCIEDAKNQFSSISNETILSMDDFSKQTLERIGHNHEEVVFMYQMLQNKEEELKKEEVKQRLFFTELTKQKEELEQLLSSASIASKERTSFIQKEDDHFASSKQETQIEAETADFSSPSFASTIPIESGIELARKRNSTKQKSNTLEKSNQKALTNVSLKKETKKNDVVFLPSQPEGDTDNKTGKILELYRQKKSILEISKLLGLGQGEVKLVIDLYGR